MFSIAASDSESEDDIFPSFLDDLTDSDDDEPVSPVELPTPMSGDESPKSSSSDPPTDESEEEEDEMETAAKVMAQRRRASRPFMSLQQRRLSMLGYKNVGGGVTGGGLQFDALTDLRRRHSTAIAIQNNMRRNSSMGNFGTCTNVSVSPPDFMYSPAKRRWLKALKLIKLMKDPWAKFHLENYPEETVIRHRYNPLLKKWVKDEIKVKVEDEPFNHGAMRSCFRLLKVSKKHPKGPVNNFVAKVYMEDVERDVYFEDVRLQMDAKLWGEEYNRHHPPKQVDIFQMAIIEFVNRPDKPLYHLEHFIEGHYIKYNSNSGFVDENMRLTPQAFSHFTFERSGHKLIIVDIQGVGDLWTDPQIHTDSGEDYGSGNLGTRGFALFFHSHVCNSICKSLKLSPFDLSRNETNEVSKYIQLQKNAATMVKHKLDPVCSPSPTEKIDLTSFLARSRTTSRTFSRSSSNFSEEDDDLGDLPMGVPGARRQRSSDMVIGSPVISTEQLRNLRSLRTRYISESDNSEADSLTEAEERQRFQQMANQKQRPSCIVHEMNYRKESMATTTAAAIAGDSVLGQIHHDLAKYHELGRFAENDNEIDWDAALFHERLAADLGIMEAILTMAKLNLGMQTEILVNCTVKPCEESIEEGVKYMLMAANSGDRSAMLYMAEAYETGLNLGKLRTKSFVEAVHWYEKAYDAYNADEESGTFGCTSSMGKPQYILRAKMAELYLQGDDDLEKDPSYAGELYAEAAEEATNAMKGKMAIKYYALSEEAYAQVED